MIRNTNNNKIYLNVFLKKIPDKNPIPNVAERKITFCGVNAINARI